MTEYAFGSEFTVGIEEELLLVDRESLQLAPVAAEVLAAMDVEPDGAGHEAYAAQIELRSPPSATASAAAASAAALATASSSALRAASAASCASRSACASSSCCLRSASSTAWRLSLMRSSSSMKRSFVRPMWMTSPCLSSTSSTRSSFTRVPLPLTRSRSITPLAPP